MITELILATVIIALSGLFLWILLALGGAFNSSKKSANGHPTGSMSWFESCYEPCMKDPRHSSDSCIMMCAWHLI
jgi:hypothetical protein